MRLSSEPAGTLAAFGCSPHCLTRLPWARAADGLGSTFRSLLFCGKGAGPSAIAQCSILTSTLAPSVVFALDFTPAPLLRGDHEVPASVDQAVAGQERLPHCDQEPVMRFGASMTRSSKLRRVIFDVLVA
jgi:hypothetical protein